MKSDSEDSDEGKATNPRLRQYRNSVRTIFSLCPEAQGKALDPHSNIKAAQGMRYEEGNKARVPLSLVPAPHLVAIFEKNDKAHDRF